MNQHELEAFADWLELGNTGSSSLAIAAVMLGGKRRSGAGRYYPLDASDFGRCFRLLEEVPAWRDRLHEMGDGNPVWAALVARWDELEALYKYDLELSNSSVSRCGQLMRGIIANAKSTLVEE